MTNTATATVEVLTAEVRVLMVGSRQVTQSVFRQLDEIDEGDGFSSIDPFGRVSFPAKDSRGGVWVVGVDDPGNLCRAYRAEPWPSFTDYYTEVERTPCCRSQLNFRAEEAGPRGGPAFEEAWVWWRDRLAQRARGDESDRYQEWAALPLIVLAGLR